jgi:hypothetical protein
MAGYGKTQQMDFKWQIARKIDRLDMGDYNTNSRFNRLVVIYGLVAAIFPKESEEEENAHRSDYGELFRPVPEIMKAMDDSIKDLRSPESKLKMMDESLSPAETTIESKLDKIWFDLSEVIYRCKITDNVRVSEEAAP